MRILDKISIVGVLLSAVFYLGSCGGGGGGGGGSGAVAKVLTGSFTTTNVVGATMAHIHDGNIGAVGPPIVVLTQSVPGGTWTVPANTVLNDAQIARLRAGGYYVNIHTSLNPEGEIRGQLVVSSTNPNMFTAILTLADEVLAVPATITPAGTAPTGSGAVTLTLPAGVTY